MPLVKTSNVNPNYVSGNRCRSQKIVHVNVRSLNAYKISLIEIWLQSVEGSNVKVLCITEHHRSSDELKLVSFTDFKLVSHCCRSRKQKGGSCIFIRRSMTCTELSKVNDQSIKYLFETCGIHINDLYIVCIYRPNTIYRDDFLNIFDALVKSLLGSTNNKKLIICGDFNINILEASRESLEFQNLLLGYNLKTNIREPTRITQSSSTCLDNIISNAKLKNPKVIDLGISDHTLQYADLPIKIHETPSLFYKFVRDLREENLQCLKEDLMTTSWERVCVGSNTNESFDRFHDILVSSFNKHVPLKRIRGDRSNRFSRGWITKGIKKSCTTKRELFVTARETNDELVLDYYKAYCRVLQRVIRHAKKAFNAQQIVNAPDKVRCTWKLINETVKGRSPKTNESFVGLRDGATIAKTNLEATNIFNNFFCKTSLKSTTSPVLPSFHPHSLFVSPVDNSDLTKVIKNLKAKDSSGSDDISTKVIKKISSAILDPLVIMINNSIIEGSFPNRLKKAIVKPIYKKGEHLDTNNYRPISLLPTISKIFEKVMETKLRSFLSSNSVLTKEQYGFQEGLSTVDAIFDMNEYVAQAIDDGDHVLAVLLDLSKAFDSVDHAILLEVLNRYGIRGKTNDWFKSYLENRAQIVRISAVNPTNNTIEDTESDSVNIKQGIPQGSILGPLLFILYVNHLPQLLRKKVVMFADDVSVFFRFNKKTDLDISTVVTQHLESIIHFFTSLNLQCNTNKTKVMYFRNCNAIISNGLTIAPNGGSPMELVEDAKFLGLCIDSFLNWKKHVEHLESRLSSFGYALKNLIHISTQRAALQAYFAFFQSNVIYGIAIWGGSVDAERIFKLQKRCVRIVGKLRFRTDSCRSTFVALKIPTLAALYTMELCKLVRRYPEKFPVARNFVSKRLNSLYEPQSQLQLPRAKTALLQRTARYNAAKIYNKLPADLKALPDKKFQIELKNYLVSKCPYSTSEL